MKRIILLNLIILAVFFANAQHPLSLSDAIGTALKNNYDMQIVMHNEKIAEIRNNWGTVGRYPYIGLTADNRNSANINDNENFVQNNFSAGANLSWTLFDGYSVHINKAKFEQLEELSHQNTAIVVEGTIQSVVLAYYSVLLEKEKLDVYQKVMTLSEDRFTQVKQRKDFGASVTYDVLQAQNAFLSDKASYLLQQVAFKNALRDLNFLMAVEIGSEFNLTSVFEAIPKDYQLADLATQMTENNKSLKNQYINQTLLENAAALAKSDFSPNISFAGGATVNNNRSNYKTSGESWTNSTNFYGNFTLSYNLFSGGNRKRAVQIANIDEEVGKVEIEQMTHELNNSLANIYEFYLVRKELLNVAGENLAAAELNLQISREKFESGAINSFNFRDVQNLYLNAATQKLEAVYDFIDTHTTMLRMSGTIIQEFE
ncbi:MAG TPA: TolC family protein [Prolixibacteraceae bacterium]|nr:TolC family protein [Prolixibacteraceae bacterium]